MSADLTSRRLRRILRWRWWVLAIASLLAVLAAVLVTQSRNSAIPKYEAVATITYNRLLGEVDDTGAQERFDSAEEIAVFVNSADLVTGIDPLSPGARAEVVAFAPELRLLFIGRGASPEEASTVATTMLDRYLAVQQLDVSDQFAERIADTAAKLDFVIASIAAAIVPPDLEDVETSSRIRELQSEVAAFAALYGALTAELLTPRTPPRSNELILADRSAASEGLRAAQNELLTLEFAVGGLIVHDVDLALLRAQEVQLRTALDSYIAQSLLDEPIGVVNELEVRDAGISPTPLAVAIVLGLSVGVLVGIAGLIVIDRIRRPLWEITELEPRYRLPEVAARPRVYGDQGTNPWYDTAKQGQRKAGIQELRAHVEGLPGFGGGLVVGLASLAGSWPHAHELAADLAAGLTHSGSWPLLVDADYGSPSHLTEYRRYKVELEDALADPQGVLDRASNRADLVDDFLGISIRNRSADAADVLAQPAFASMLDTAQGIFDVVIVACPPTSSASYHVLSQRLDVMILVATAGNPAPADVLNALHTLEERRAFPAGVVLIRARVGPISLIREGTQESASQDVISQPEWHWSKVASVTTEGTVESDPDSVTGGSEAFQNPRTAGSRQDAVVGDADIVPLDPDTTAPSPAESPARRVPSKRDASTTPTDDLIESPSGWSFRNREG